ncbi:SDR family NAD(P)-dependent oxidoreductase [Mesorhizobium sp. B2-4-13]|nr:SDR family NAD(P)-dependent oxidoreductase [Mesorhizobium sp. B2-4-13]
MGERGESGLRRPLRRWAAAPGFGSRLLFRAYPLLVHRPEDVRNASAGCGIVTARECPAADSDVEGNSMNSQTTSPAADKTLDVLQALLALAGDILETDPSRIDPDEPLGHLGFDSASLKLFAARLSQRFGTQIDTVLLFTYPALTLLSDYITEQGLETIDLQEPAPARAEQSSRNVASNRDIAIIGIACRLPGAATKEEFWRNQTARRNAIREIPKRRWDWGTVFGDPLREAGRTDVKWGGFIEGEDQFAPEFFGISVYEAEFMDPQHRLFLKAAWEAIWDAGHDPGALAGRQVGVFAGVQFQDYQKLLDADGLLSAQACTGNAHAMLANRVSFMLDVHGPSEAIDTACSSSLVAIHNAVRAIRLGECELAIAGGVNLLLTPDLFIMGRQLGVLSPTGQCRTFDAGADGYVRGEGIGALLLKPLNDAIRDRDHIHAVIKGTAVNHGGKAASLTAPNSRAQADLMTRALNDAGLTPDDIAYVEMHGTGTELGDPIEVEGVKSAFRKLRAEHGLSPSPCTIGSVKTNIGHLEPAAGVAGVINAAMAIANRTLPGLSNFRDRNPHIQLDEGFAIQAETGAWPEKQAQGPLGALVNSFGFGGANASAVLQEHRPATRAFQAAELVYVPLSAGTPEQLRSYARALADAIAVLPPQDGALTMRDIAFTLQSRNEGRAERAVVGAASLAGLIEGLQAIAAGDALPTSVIVAGSGRPATGCPEHVMRWLDHGRAQWPDILGARRCSLPIPAWPDRTCWFKPRMIDAHSNELPAQMTYLEPFWRKAETGAARKLDGKCIWIVGRSEEQTADFEALLRSTLPGKATLITSLIGPGNAPQPSLATWNIAGDEPDIVVVLPASVGERAGEQDETAVLFSLAKTLMEHAFNSEVDLFFLAREDFGVSPAFDALPALAKSAFLENERLRLHTLFVGSRGDGDWRTLAAREIARDPSATPATIRFEGARAVRGLREIKLEQSGRDRCWFGKDGVYLFAGGAGELGYRLVERLVAEIDATFILCGRSPLGGQVAQRLEALRHKAGSRVDYIQCDIADARQTRAMVDAIMQGHGRLDGVVNMVTAHNDAYLFRKSWDEFVAVSAAKVEGTVNLDRATAHISVDFFVVFSSLASLGLAGGSDYAYGCAFQNAFADWRGRAVAAGQRHGASHAISWSRWQWDKYVTAGFDDWFASIGYAFLDIDTGLNAWRAMMQSAGTEIFALSGWPDRIFGHLDIEAGLLRSTQAADKTRIVKDVPREPDPRDAAVTLASDHTKRAMPPRQSSAAVAPLAGAAGGLQDVLAEIVRDLLKLDALDPQTPFPSLGLDSVMAIRLIVLIEQRLSKRLTPKELLQHPSVAALADYMLSAEPGSVNPDLSPPEELDAIATYLASSLKRMLRTDEIAADARFGQLGVDSIIAVKLASEFDKRFAIGISPRWFIDFPSVDRMAHEIEKRRSVRQ